MVHSMMWILMPSHLNWPRSFPRLPVRMRSTKNLPKRWPRSLLQSGQQSSASDVPLGLSYCRAASVYFCFNYDPGKSCIFVAPDTKTDCSSVMHYQSRKRHYRIVLTARKSLCRFCGEYCKHAVRSTLHRFAYRNMCDRRRWKRGLC